MISAKIIADSISPAGVRITTFELEFPRIILAEQNTHRAFSRNAQSTRAIPLIKTKKVKRSAVSNTLENPFIPQFTKNQPGMMANEPMEGWNQILAQWLWMGSMYFNASIVWLLAKLGASKQHAGRLLEPFQNIRVVCTATDFDNYFYLRAHEAAQPEIRELAEAMLRAMNANPPIALVEGSWHMPYFNEGFWTPDMGDLDAALRVSSSCCAQVSFRKLDQSQETADRIFKRMIQKGEPIHSSPFEHQATPLTDPNDRSGNFRGWEQYRQQIEGNVCERFDRLVKDESEQWQPLMEDGKFDPWRLI